MDFLKVKTNLEESKKEWQIKIDQNKVEQVGLTPEIVGEQVSLLMKKSPIGQLTIDDEKNNYYVRT